MTVKVSRYATVDRTELSAMLYELRMLRRERNAYRILACAKYRTGNQIAGALRSLKVMGIGTHELSPLPRSQADG